MLSEDAIIKYCLSLKGACVRYPYGNKPLVMSTEDVHEFCDIYEGSKPIHLVMKCATDEAISLRKKYPNNIKPGYRCNKHH